MKRMPGGSLAMQGSEGSADTQQRALLDNPVDKPLMAITAPPWPVAGHHRKARQELLMLFT
ncbi:hypothetical protein AO265_16025 [Pseudomonas sp. ABAC61]|nr:hypothetical protein AO265_16025 [Pseudomonas sp. ABAC61]